MHGYRTGENYAYLPLPAQFLIFDEYVAFMEMLGTKENAAVLNKLKQIVMLGRQARFFLILACQRPDAGLTFPSGGADLKAHPEAGRGKPDADPVAAH